MNFPAAGLSRTGLLSLCKGILTIVGPMGDASFKL